MKTLADEVELMRGRAVDPETFDPTCPHTLVTAPCCGRRVAADAILDLRGIKTEIRGGGYLPKRDHDWGCTDACVHHLIVDKSNGWTKSKLFRALGAPADAIRHERARELQHEAVRAAHAKGEGINPGEAFKKAHASLKANVRELPGTERPDV